MTASESDRARRERGCDGKRRYATKRGAEGVVIAIARQQKDETITSYKCVFCGFWHVGHRRTWWQR